MGDYPADLRYTHDHEWVMATGSKWRVGITTFAAKQLGDIVYVELPKLGEAFPQAEPFGTVESVKAVSELYAPVTGKVVAINNKTNDSPELLNDDPYGEGWLIELEPSQKSELDGLMSADDYAKLLVSGED